MQLYPTRGPTAKPSLHRLDSRTLCGFHSYCWGWVYAAAACAERLDGGAHHLLAVAAARAHLAQPRHHASAERAAALLGSSDKARRLEAAKALADGLEVPDALVAGWRAG